MATRCCSPRRAGRGASRRTHRSRRRRASRSTARAVHDDPPRGPWARSPRSPRRPARGRIEVLEDEADALRPESRSPGHGESSEAPPADRDASRVQSVEGAEHGEKRRLAAPRDAAEDHRLPGSRRARDPVGHRHRPVGDGWLFVSPPSTRPSPPIPDRPVRAARPPPPVPSLPDASRDRRERPPSPRPGIGLPRRTRRPPHDGGPAPWGARRVMGTNDA